MTYPEKLAVDGPNWTTVNWIRTVNAKHVAEVGVYRGHTSVEIARVLPVGGSLDLFDFDDVVEDVAKQCRTVVNTNDRDRGRAEPSINIRAYGNSRKVKDSYNWSLMKLLEIQAPIWDYVFIDGAHTWEADALAFLLVDRLLKPGGFVDFDDYHWTIANSTAMQNFEHTDEWYTETQKRTKQVALVVERLCKRMDYVPVLHEKIYRKRVANAQA